MTLLDKEQGYFHTANLIFAPHSVLKGPLALVQGKYFSFTVSAKIFSFTVFKIKECLSIALEINKIILFKLNACSLEQALSVSHRHD
jgi:hypothetical protein